MYLHFCTIVQLNLGILNFSNIRGIQSKLAVLIAFTLKMIQKETCLLEKNLFVEHKNHEYHAYIKVDSRP